MVTLWLPSRASLTALLRMVQVIFFIAPSTSNLISLKLIRLLKIGRISRIGRVRALRMLVLSGWLDQGTLSLGRCESGQLNQ